LEPADDNKIKNVKRINEHIKNELKGITIITGWEFDEYAYKNNTLNFKFENNDNKYYIPFSEQEIKSITKLLKIYDDNIKIIEEIEKKLKEGDEKITEIVKEIVKEIVVGKSGKRNHEEVEQEDEQYSTPKGKREKLRKID